ncbi:hypothetical protein RUM44_002509 [Polyplax serrata]|uniref:Tudor domain-containing protein n=1 Tax=Polyplax serrata TaxID=468196 RepID=A0ABR1AEZ4_POLSC
MFCTTTWFCMKREGVVRLESHLFLLLESGKGSFPAGSNDPSAVPTDQDLISGTQKNKFKVGERCMVMSSEDGM